MSIRARIRALMIVVSLTIAAMAAFAYIGLEATSYQLDRAERARAQLTANYRLAIDANRYSEQIAELLLVGAPERPDFDSARQQVTQSLRALGLATDRERAILRSEAERQEERIESERLRRMRTLFREIDRAVERLLLLNEQGQRDASIALFRSEIENRLDAEFARLIADALGDEQAEVTRIEADAARLATSMRNTELATSAALVALAVISGLLFARSIGRPIKALTEGASAIESGDLTHRIAVSGSDELAILSQRFNAMAEQLVRQRDTILEAQGGLELEVAERTAELALANERLRAIDHQRLRLLTDVNHELRTPLTALRGEAEIALRGASKPEEEYRRALANVVSRAGDLSRLTEDLLFMARTEAEESRFDLQRVKVDELVRRTVTDAEVLARDRRIRFDLTCAAGNVDIRGDARRLRQVILIVLDNAVKYADASSVVRIATSAEGDVVQIAVRDHGEGVEAHDVPRVFERFFRGGETRDDWVGGAGLGLPIARGIVEKHDGSIQLSSEVGVGTEVVIRLPVAA